MDNLEIQESKPYYILYLIMIYILKVTSIRKKFISRKIKYHAQ